jgi:hypothetical protein
MNSLTKFTFSAYALHRMEQRGISSELLSNIYIIRTISLKKVRQKYIKV